MNRQTTIKEKQNYKQGNLLERVALNLLRKKYTVEDRSEWAKWGSGKEYAMDWLIEDFNIAVEFKFKTTWLVKLYENYGIKKITYTINHDHLTKYIKYLDNHPEIARGYFWVMDKDTFNEYRIDMRYIQRLIDEDKVYTQRNVSTKKHYESGPYYAIPLDYFEEITDKPYSIGACSRL